VIDLQANTHVSQDFATIPSDRKPLQTGRGKLIRMKAFLVEAHHADWGVEKV